MLNPVQLGLHVENVALALFRHKKLPGTCTGGSSYSAVYRVRLKMTQHVKCDYLVTPENFCAKFGRIV